MSAEREEASWGVSQWGQGRRRRNEPCKPSSIDTVGRRAGEPCFLQRDPLSVWSECTFYIVCRKILNFVVCSPQRNLTKLTLEHKELEERLKEEKSQKEQFKNTKNEIEEERRLLDRTVEKLQREVRLKDHLLYNSAVKISRFVFL